MARKIMIAEVRNVFKRRGYKLLENKYISAKTKMRYICPHHPDKENSISYDNLKRGKGCPYCGGTAKYTYEFVKQKFEEKGYELLETEYVNVYHLMRYKCPRHPKDVMVISFGALRRGRGCKKCGIELMASKRRLSFKFVYNQFKEKGYELLENTFLNSSTLMSYKCIKHPQKILFTTYANFSQGKGVPLLLL